MVKRSNCRGSVRLCVAVVLGAGLLAAPISGADEAGPDAKKIAGTVQRSAPVTPFVFDGDVRDLPPLQRWKPGDPVKEIPRRAYVDPANKITPAFIEEGVDRLLELQQASQPGTFLRTFDAPDRNFDGQGFSGVNPPDPSGDVGPNHYIQMINDGGGATVVIYDKALPTPGVLASFALDGLGSGSCAGGLGDPIVLYDRPADRWMLSEFSSSGNNLCMYVSQTGDPVSGGWFFYGFTAPSFPDYPKYGVWPAADGSAGSYIVTSNETSSGVYAMDRANMLAGNAATFQRFTIADLPGFSFNAVTPADMDGGENPLSGAPAVIMRMRDTEVHSGPSAPEDVLEIWHFDVDWNTTSNTTLTQLPDIDIAEFSSELCGLTAFACFQQPGTGTTLDPLREPIMNRLQYRNFNDHEVLVGNFVTDVDGTERGGVRWFEVRRTGGIGDPWLLHQEGVVSPDADSRFMAASAMDQSGNIAVAYNVSSSSTFPGLRYSGRLADDPAGTMQAEASIVEGAASNSSNRYGDYSQMGVDPADDCTFWFTGEYNDSSSWSTRIASFRFDACGCDLFPSPLALAGGNNGDNRIDLSWSDSELDTVVEYRVLRSRTAGGPYTTVATISDSSPGVGNGGGGYAYSDTTVSGGITYYYVVRASDGGACTSEPSNEISDTATGICLLAPLFDGARTVETNNSGICTLNLTWNAATPECGASVSYDVYRSTTPGFDPMPFDLLESGVTGTAFSDVNNLSTGTPYHYVVRAVDTFNGVSETNSVEVTGVPLGNLVPPLFVDDGGDTVAASMTSSSPWGIDGSGGNTGPGVYTTGDYGNNTCADLTTPPIVLNVNNTLEFWSRYEIESSWDKGEVQITTDGGASWQRLEVGYPGNSSNTSDSCGFPLGSFFTGTNTSWERYSADLSAFNGQTVQIRFRMSTDGSVTAGGWFIDDIAVINQAAACATASSCADNPLVDVTPDGPLETCSLSIPELTANLSGGVGPFTYQWYRDGSPIADATDPFFQPVTSTTHSYNVRVKAVSCPDEVADGQPTTIAVESAPRFDGVVSVDDQELATCGIDVGWDAATSLCPGPVVYNVYRSTSAGVIPEIDNLVVSGLTTAGFMDTVNLDSGTTYHYLVEAIDLSTGVSDGNSVEDSVAPAGPDSTAFFDDAGDTGASQLALTAPWNIDVSGGSDGQATYTTGSYTSNLCAGIESPAIAITNGASLSFSSRFEIESNWDKGVVQISTDGGTNWDRVEVNYPFNANQTADACGLPTGMYFTNDSLTWTEYTADLSPWAGQSGILRWLFSSDSSVTDNGWRVDDIEVFAAQACATAASGPAPVPDGRNGTTALRADRRTAAGDTIGVTWDVSSCVAADYNLLFGDLADVATVTLGGSACGLGTSGSYNWSGVGSGSLFFVVVGTDGAGAESSWGFSSLPVERNGMTASGQCGVTTKDTTATCP